MFPQPVSGVTPDTFAFETQPVIHESGFREYDARWIFGRDLNLMGVQRIGMALGVLLHEKSVGDEIIVAHDFRAYSAAVKMALITGLLSSGIHVRDIGLALSPMAYFAQFALDIPAVAMVTASHNENGWTGLKMGIEPPLTFSPEEMTFLKELVYTRELKAIGGGIYTYHPDFLALYRRGLLQDVRLKHPVKAVCACGNGTAGAFVPALLTQIGVEVVPVTCTLDSRFPKYNPNPEDLKMLQDVCDAVRESGAHIGFAFDGDGDRCGVVDDQGQKIFADKIGVLLARDLCSRYPGRKIVIDVKSTLLFQKDPVLCSLGVEICMAKTGHSYIKKKVQETGAILGVEKSGHYFFNDPIGYGYDDGVRSAIALLEMLDRHRMPLSQHMASLPKTWSSPTFAAECADSRKYDIVAQITETLLRLHAQSRPLCGMRITECLTLNGIRVTFEDDSWGLVRASSNKPEIVVVVESPVSYKRMKQVFEALDQLLQDFPEVGPYNQMFEEETNGEL